MKIKKSVLYTLNSVVCSLYFVLCMTACVDEYKYEPIAADNHGIFLKADKTEYVLTEAEEGKIELTVLRHDTVEAQTYGLACDFDGMQVPATVSFAVGQREQIVPVSFDLPAGTLNKKATISVRPEDAYLYGKQAQTFSLYRCRTQQTSAKVYIINWVDNMYSAEDVTRTLCYMGNDDGVETYLVKNMYTEGLDIKFTVNEKGEAMLENQPAYYAAIEEDSDEQHLVYVYGIGKLDEKTNVITFALTHAIENVGYYQVPGETIEL